MLVKHKLEIFDFSGASNVQKKIIETKRNAALPSDYISLLKIMVASAKGYISPEAKRLIDLILKLEPSNIQTRFFNGHFYAQDGQLDRAEEIWDQLIVDYETRRKPFTISNQCSYEIWDKLGF